MYLFWGQSNCSAEYIRHNFGKEWANWFKLVSSQPNHQLKKKAIFSDLNFVVTNISYYFDMTMAASLKDTRRQLYVWRGGFKSSISQTWKLNHQLKKKAMVTDLNFVATNISYYFDMTMAASLKDTRRQRYVWRGGCKNTISQTWKP